MGVAAVGDTAGTGAVASVDDTVAAVVVMVMLVVGMMVRVVGVPRAGRDTLQRTVDITQIGGDVQAGGTAVQGHLGQVVAAGRRIAQRAAAVHTRVQRGQSHFRKVAALRTCSVHKQQPTNDWINLQQKLFFTLSQFFPEFFRIF